MTAPGLGAWRFVTTFGVVSLLADVVYEGARSITVPLPASRGGFLYERSVPLLIGVVVAIQGLALVALPLVRRQAVSSSRGSADPR